MAQATEGGGIRCPNCGRTNLQVTQSRRGSYGFWRRRVCSGCNTRVSTIEHTMEIECEPAQTAKRETGEQIQTLGAHHAPSDD